MCFKGSLIVRSDNKRHNSAADTGHAKWNEDNVTSRISILGRTGSIK